MAENYQIIRFDKGELVAVVNNRGYGVAIANGAVTHTVYAGSLEQKMLDPDFVDTEVVRQRFVQQIKEGTFFGRSTPQYGDFTFEPMGLAIPLDIYIQGSQECLQSKKTPENNRAIAQKYGFDINPFDDERNVIEGLIVYKNSLKEHLLKVYNPDSITGDFKSMKPFECGDKNSKSGGRIRLQGDEE